jgi:hypothetical protein
MDELRQTQMALFLVGVGAIRERDNHALELRRAQVSSARRATTVAGELGDQLAMVLWRGEQLAVAVRTQCCCNCAARLGPFVSAYNTAAAPRSSTVARWLPVRGSVS